MSTINQMNNSFEGVNSIKLTKNLYLEEGLINNSSPSVNVTVGTTTTLLTVPAGITGYDINEIKFVLSGNNTVGNLILSIGTNAATYNDILPSTTLTGFNTVGDVYRVPLTGLVHRCVPSDVITVNITNPVTGVGALLSVFMIGEIV